MEGALVAPDAVRAAEVRPTEGLFVMAFPGPCSEWRAPDRRPLTAAAITSSSSLPRGDNRQYPTSPWRPLFEAVVEATEEAIYHSLLKATTTHGFHGTCPRPCPS